MKILLEYLDFETPIAPGAPHIVKVYRPTTGVFPATDLVVNFQSRAIPDLKKIITNEDSKKLCRRNAAIAYFWLNRNAVGIAFFVHAAHRAADPQISKELTDLAKRMAEACADQTACRAALDTE